MSIQKWRGPLLVIDRAFGWFLIVLVAIGLPIGLYYSIQIADTSFCTTTRDYAGFWIVREAVRTDGKIIPFIDSSLTLIWQSGEKPAKASMPNMMIQPDAEQVPETYTIKLSCFGDSVIMNDSRYHYFTGTYAIELSQQWNREDTLFMSSDQINMKLVPVSMKGVIENMGN